MVANETSSVPTQKSLRERLLKGASYEAMGFVLAQGFRLASNMVLTRLLAPEAFGLATLVMLVNQGLVMFSDLGLQPALVQNRRGGEEPFLNTAWTLQVIQGVVLFLIAMGLAWPLARFYDQPELTLLITLGSSGLVARGLISNARFSLRRKMAVGPLVTLELSTQVFSSVATILLAYFWMRSVWALVLGMVLGSVFSMLASFRLAADFPHRLTIDRDARESILHVGKWVFLSSLVAFLSQQGDRIILGKMVSVAELGVYSIAVLLSGALSGAVYKVIQGAVFPALAEVKERGRNELKVAYYRIRKALDLTVLPALGGLSALASVVVDLLYDPRFAAAGWMLAFLVIKSAMQCVLMPCQSCLFAVGRVRYAFLEGAGRAVWLILTMPIGFKLLGTTGLVTSVALSEVPVLLLLWPAFRQEGLLSIRHEMRSVGFFGLGYAFATLIRPSLEAILP